uniref:Uncharacterized protein n=1 Tax=Tanacetum cinerariifolium TaxID=118510 RepID=A0A699GY62_TANCI|nr:hypothetical protein [Tanacetum cinerariifolium]
MYGIFLFFSFTPLSSFKKDLKGTCIENGFKQAFMSLFGQDDDTFSSTMLLNVDQLQKQLDKDEFQEDGSMAAFWVINIQFQKFIDSQFTLDYDSQMADKYFAEYTEIEVKQFRETLLQHMRNVKKFVAERTCHQRQYDRRVNKRQMQDGTKFGKHNTSSWSCNDTDANDADIRLIYNEEPMAEEVNLRVKIQSHKTRNSNKPVEQKSRTQKPSKQIFTRHRFSPNKSSAMYEKTSPRSGLRWQPTGKIIETVGLRRIPTRKLLDSCSGKVDNELSHGSNVDISKIHACKQTLDLSAGTSLNDQKKQRIDLCTELESLFGPFFDEYLNGENQVVSKSFVVTTADASDKRQQQPDSTLSTSTLATTVTADGNFDL